MKKNLTWMGILVMFIFGLTLFTGCAEKKAVVESDATQAKEAAPAQQAPAAKDYASLPDTSAEKSVDLEKMAGQGSPVGDINFDFDSFSILPDAREILKRNADYFLKNKVSSIIVEGHCDERGTAEYNMALGERRAEETKKYLVNMGIKESAMKTVSFGEERPLVAESNEEAWAKNRRAHFVVNP